MVRDKLNEQILAIPFVQHIHNLRQSLPQPLNEDTANWGTSWEYGPSYFSFVPNTDFLNNILPTLPLVGDKVNTNCQLLAIYLSNVTGTLSTVSMLVDKRVTVWWKVANHLIGNQDLTQLSNFLAFVKKGLRMRKDWQIVPTTQPILQTQLTKRSFVGTDVDTVLQHLRDGQYHCSKVEKLSNNVIRYHLRQWDHPQVFSLEFVGKTAIVGLAL